jgi:hypothetical protein
MRSGLLERLRRRTQGPERAVPATAPAGLGEPPAEPEAADDAQLDELRGELVRELDRLATRGGGSAPQA